MCQSSNLIMSFERFQKDIKFYDPDLVFREKIAMPLKRQGFITSIAYDDKNRIFAIATTDCQVHFYSKTKIRIEHQKSGEAPCIQNRIFYMPKQQLWLTAGSDHQLRHWSIAKSV